MHLSTRLIPFLFHFMRKQPIGFLAIFMAGLLWPLCETLFPYFTKLLINALQPIQGNVATVFRAAAWPIGLLLGNYLVLELSLRVLNLTALFVFPRFRSQICTQVFDYTQHHSHRYFSENLAGSIADKLANLPTSCHRVLEIFFGSFINILVAFFVSTYLLASAHPLFALIILLWFVGYMSLLAYFLPKCDHLAAIHSEAKATLTGKIVDSITNIASVQLFARQQYELAYLRRFQNEEIQRSQHAEWASEMMQTCQSILSFIMLFSMLWVLLKGWSLGWLTLGDISLVTMLTFSITNLIWFFAQQMRILLREIGVIRSALQLISQPHEIKDAPHAKTLRVTRGEIQFKNVTFTYPNKEPLFRALTVTIHPGEKVGLVGFSGAGKTTFIHLLLRRFEIDSGQILIDGQAIDQVTLASLYQQIAVIPQDPTLFNRTLMENIRYGRIEATDTEVIAASKLAHCHEFAKQLEKGYQTEVGERGIKLSGGQRQRIAIARAILKNAPILLLDEATSALDSVTERYIQESLDLLMKGRTTLIVAHRLSTLANMDRILVFHKGAVVEEGSMQDLLAKEGHFAKLWHLQAEGFLPDIEHEDELEEKFTH